MTRVRLGMVVDQVAASVVVDPDAEVEVLAGQVVRGASRVMTMLAEHNVDADLIAAAGLNTLRLGLAHFPELQYLTPAPCATAGCRRRDHSRRNPAGHVHTAAWAPDRRVREVG